MPHIPDGSHQVTPYPFAPLSLPGCRSISGDDLCAWCRHLLYRPGELSLCPLSLADGIWPACCDEDGYAQSCPSLHLNHHFPAKQEGNAMKNMLTLNGDIAKSHSLPQRDADAIVCTPVPDEQRIAFWPQHFGGIPQWILLEPRIFGRMDHLCDSYQGGIWNFYKLSNGGAFMAPETGDNDETWTLFNDMNGNGAVMSAEAAGITACLTEYSHHASRTECDAMTEHYYRLRDYALNHPECNAIMRIID